MPGLSLSIPIPFPIRGRSTLALELPAASRVDLALIDVAGRHLGGPIRGQLLQAGRHTIALDVTGLAPGYYLARLTTEHGTVARRVIVVGR